MMRRVERYGFAKALAVALAAALLCIGGYAGRADATIWHVTSAADDPSNPAAGTLRHAINNAWNNDIIAIDFCDQEIALKSEIYIQKDITVIGYGTSHPTVVRQTTVGERVFRIKSYAIVRFEYLTITGGSATATGTNPGGGGILNYGYSLTLYRCTVSGNTSAGCGGGIDNYGKVILNIAWVRDNSAVQGGGICTRGGGICELYTSTVTGNTPDQLSGPYSANSTCTIGDAPNKSATAFAGYAGTEEPEPRSIEGDDDVAEVKNALSDSGSALYGAVADALSADLSRTPAGTGMALYYANTFEDVAIESQDLVVEYTASWPENVRYYPLFCRADGSGYEIPGRGVQFEIKAGQSLPDGVTPPDFYVPGEGLMTWRNVVTDGGSYDLNPTAGAVTFRVCSVRAAEATGDKGSGGGCSTGAGFAPLALLLGLPLAALPGKKRTGRKRSVRSMGALLVLAATLCFGGAGEAATLMVTTGDDDGSAKSLRSVVAAAANGDSIVFAPLLSTVSLTGYLFVNKAVTIEGPVTIRQTTPGERVLYVTGACTLKNLTITGGSLGEGNGALGAGLYSHADLTMTNCTVTGNTGGGGIYNSKNIVLQGCTISNNTANGWIEAGGISNTDFGYNAVSVTMTDCVVENNTSSGGESGGIYNGSKGTLTMVRTTVRNNSNGSLGGGMYLGANSTMTTLTDHCAVYGNSPDNICCGYGVTYTADSTCTIGSAPNKSATAFSGYSGETEPEPRSIVGDSDVAAVKTALANPESGLYGVIEQALAADLGKTVPEKSASLATLAGMSATLYDANTFEDVTLTSADLSVEYTASWPSNVRYYALFARADGSGYELADRGVQFELRAGQTLPDGVTPPDFYVPGEGLMTWKNIVMDGGSYDLNPTAGAVTIRVCSVRAAEAAGDKGSGGGCDIAAGAGFAPLALLLGLPLAALATLVRRKDR